VIIARATQSGGSALDVIGSSSELLEDTRNAGEIILHNLQNSVYVYPPLAELELNDSATFDVTNPNTGSNTWMVAQDPIIAMIVAPRSSMLDCPSDPDACLTFVAYYTIKRQLATGPNGISFGNVPLTEDTANPNAQMLFEYRKVLLTDTLSPSAAPPLAPDDFSLAGNLSGGVARLVADYIDPIEGFKITGKNCKYGAGLFQQAADCTTITPVLVDFESSMFNGNFTLKTLYNKGSKSFNTPILTYEFSPRNLY